MPIDIWTSEQHWLHVMGALERQDDAPALLPHARVYFGKLWKRLWLCETLKTPSLVHLIIPEKWPIFLIARRLVYKLPLWEKTNSTIDWRPGWVHKLVRGRFVNRPLSRDDEVGRLLKLLQEEFPESFDDPGGWERGSGGGRVQHIPKCTFLHPYFPVAMENSCGFSDHDILLLLGIQHVPRKESGSGKHGPAFGNAPGLKNNFHLRDYHNLLEFF